MKKFFLLLLLPIVVFGGLYTSHRIWQPYREINIISTKDSAISVAAIHKWLNPKSVQDLVELPVFIGDSIQVPVSSDGSQKDWALRLLPSDYATSGTKKYPLLISLHGAGQGHKPLSNLYNSPDGAVAYQIEQGNFNGTAINPADGQTYSFITICPQDPSGWSVTQQQLLYVLNYLYSNYRVDTSRVYITGLSAGGEGLVNYVTGFGMSPGPNHLPAAVVPMSYAQDYFPTSTDGRIFVNDSIPVWGFGDSINDIHGGATAVLVDVINGVKPGYARFTQYLSGDVGHCCWAHYYIPSFRQTFTWKGVTSSMNIYEWMLINTRGTVVSGPTANAGGNKNITLPTSSVTLSGSGTPGTGATITSYGWSQISGPNTATIGLPSSASTSVSNLIQGTYDFRLTVTNSNNQTATDDAIVVVNAASQIIANAGPDQSITLPSNSVVLDGSGSTGTITSYGWSQISGPNTANLATPSNVTTTASGLIAGVYNFLLTVNGGASTDRVQITVNASSPYPPCGPRNKYIIASGSTGYSDGDTAFFYNGSGNNAYLPGDSLVFTNNAAIPRWKYIEIDNFSGNPSCPLVITNAPGSQTLVENLAGDTTNGHNGTINLFSDSYVKVDGNQGNPGVYGFLIQGDPVLRYDLGAGAQIIGTSHSIEWVGTKIRNIGTGLWMKNNGDCNLQDNYPNPGVDSVFFHDNWIVGTWNEGMYIGNTSPDNAPSGACAYDMRPITCADTTFFPVPPRIGDLYIYNNIVDSTGRGGIQIAGASVGISYVYNNTVSHNGMNGDDAQGTAISTGTYSRVIIHDNICRTTYTWAIALLGASSTNFAQQIYNNSVDSSGYNKWYDLSTTSKAKINPWTEPIFTDTLPWPQSIFVDTKPTCNPVDSTTIWIKNNVLGLCKRPSQQICIQNDHNTLQLKGNNIICNNFLVGTQTLGQIFLDPTSAGFTYSTDCAAPPPPVIISIRSRKRFRVTN